ncbi:uncharacterized protein LOC141691175 [Apium graveolens]|uniref:uncharacterized protein LOC141691175 n=1 Tax=Apium graveolens TaxID=4045 RepID=UPI003D7B7278
MNVSDRHWSRPDKGYVKVNVDAAMFKDLRCVGIVAVIRDGQGRFLRARSRKVGVHMRPREAKTLSLKEALSWVKGLGYQRCVFEIAAKQVGDACKGPLGKSYFYIIVLDYVELCKHIENVLVIFIHRSTNGVAHMLAQTTHSMSGWNEWVDYPPEYVSEALLYDFI